MKGRTSAFFLFALGLSACATLPPYCNDLYQHNLRRADLISDRDIARFGVVLVQTGYAGDCPCPYDTDSDGRKCGERSAYSRGGPLRMACYPEQIYPPEYPRLRRECARQALPTECGGDGVEYCYQLSALR